MRALFNLTVAVASAALVSAAIAAAAVPAYIATAVASHDRPAADTARDAGRKPAEVIAFSGMKRGSVVGDLIPGGGYYDRIFAGVVGPKGHVYGFYPAELHNFIKQPLPADGATPDPKFPVFTALVAPVNDFAAPKPLDIVWISDNYHDLHDPFFAPADVAKINAAVFKALKPGGIYLVLDHVAEPGSGLRDTNTRHRIDETVVKTEVEAAGFKLVGESEVLKNPADTHMDNVFVPAIRGHTDQFILKFRKPG
ncbi:MAG TPA: methyltransferase [Caulobacteraceae bacterium]|jgi:predicted methyltransferase